MLKMLISSCVFDVLKTRFPPLSYKIAVLLISDVMLALSSTESNDSAREGSKFQTKRYNFVWAGSKNGVKGTKMAIPCKRGRGGRISGRISHGRCRIFATPKRRKHVKMHGNGRCHDSGILASI